jgi:hypothetical protein
MCNIVGFWNTDFGKFLLERRLASTGEEKFMVHWVRRFFESLYREQILGLLCLAGAIINMPCKQPRADEV